MASNDPFDINNDGKFFLLKTESMSELGSRDGDGNPVTFFLPNNIGVIQSTALLQQLNQNEFKASTPQPNTSFINFLSTGTFETSGLVFARYSWTVDSSDPFKTQQNFANATLNNCVFFKGSTQKSLEVGWDGAFNSNKTNGDKLFSDIIIELSLHISPASTVSLDNASVKEFIEGMLVSNYTEVSGGGDTNLSDVGSNNIIDAINRLISRSTSTRNSMIEDPNAACTFEQIEGKMKNLESSFEAYVGKVFSEGAAQELFNITEKADAYSAIIQNYELISGQSFSGLIDTPTGHISGMYLLSNGSGIIFTGIERIVDDLTNLGFGVTGFTGLHDTPSDYQEGKYLRSTAEGLEYVDLTSDGFGVTGFTGLHDTPTDYQGHRGDYLVVNDGETGIHFTGIEKIANDLTDYGFLDGVGGGGSTILPSGSILQKVVSPFADITSLSTVGTEIASMDITPKSSDSQLLCEITFNWQERGTNGSQQQGKFYIDDVEFGSHWYNHISSTANRLQTSLRATTTVSDTSTKTISHKLILDSLDPSLVQSIVMSVTEIAQSDYTLAGGGGSSTTPQFCKAYFAASQPSVGNGGVVPINLDSSALEQQSEDWTFLSPVHNKLGIKIPEDGLYNIVGEALVDLSNSTTRSDWQANVVNHAYEVIDENGQTYASNYNNKATTNGDNLKVDIYTANVFLTAGTILTAHTSHFRSGGGGSYVYNNTVSYLNIEKAGGGAGGSSSGGGGFQSNQITKDNLAGDYILPDVIYVPMIRSGASTLRPFYFNGFATDANNLSAIQYEWIIGGTERFSIEFLNDTDGSYYSARNHGSTTTTFNLSVIPSATTNQPSIKEFIADDRAVYFGGGGGSSTGGGQIHATFSGSTGQILTKSNNWDTYVDSISFPQGSWNGYARINYKNSFTNSPTVLATADHRENVPNLHVFAQVQAQSADGCGIVIGDTEGVQVQAAFNVVIFSDEIAGGGAGGESSGTNIVFESNIDSMIGTLSTFVNVPHVPTIDTYSAWDSSNHVWVAPKNMTVLVNCNHQAQNDHKHLVGQIRIGTVVKAIQGSIKNSIDTSDSSINLSAVIEVEAGDEISSLVSVQGAGSSVNLNDQIMTITELGGGGGGSSATPQFCRAQVSSSSRIGFLDADVDLDASQLATDSQNWIHTNTTRNTVGILVPEDGLYDISFNILPVIDNNWTTTVSMLHTALQVVKADGTNVVIQDTKESKNVGNGTPLHNHLYLDNVHLNEGDFLYLRCSAYSSNTALSWAVRDDFSFLSVSKSAAGGSSSSTTTTFDALTDTPVDYINHSGKYLVVTDGEDGVGFSGIEKIAADLTDYGFAGGGASEFSSLTDTPSEYTNHSGKYVVVNDQEDGLSFVPAGDLLSLASLEGYDFCSDFHLQSNTTNNSSIFQDQSINSFSIGSNNVVHSTAITPIYGASSLLFDGNAYLAVGNNQDFAVYSQKSLSSFTIQTYIKPILLNSSPQGILGNCGQITEHGFRFYIDSNDKLVFDICKGLGSQTSVSVTSSQSIVVDQWQHVAIVNENNNLTLYIDGLNVGSTEWTNEASSISPSIALHIGALPMGSNSDLLHFNGYMQDVRIDRTAFNSQYFPPTELTNSTCNPAKLDIGFTSLIDSPVNYTNAGGKYVRVSENESELEFVGITIAGSTNNEFTNSFLNSDVTTDISIPEFNFGGLTIGKTYRLSSTICLNADTASDFPKIDFYNSDQKMFSLFSKGSTSTVSNSMLFIARGDTVYASGRDLSSTAYIMGDQEVSFVQLELPPSIAVELDEEVIPPIVQPGEGIFSIEAINVNARVKDVNIFDDLAELIPQDIIFDIDSINTHVNLNTEFDHNIPISDLDAGMQPLNSLDIRDIKTAINIKPDLDLVGDISLQDLTIGNLNSIKIASTPVFVNIQDTQSENLNTITPTFGVLYISSMNLSINTKNRNVDDQTANLPHPNYIGTI